MNQILVMQLLVEATPEYTRSRLEEGTENYADVPVEWQDEYYPTLIPEGLVISDLLDDTVVYSFPDAPMWQFMFSELAEGTTIHIDNIIIFSIM